MPADSADAAPALAELVTARLLLAAATLLAYTMIMPVFEPGMLVAGDDAIHSAYTLESLRLWQEEKALFGWTDLYGLGEPIYLVRPPGFYWTVLATYGLGGGLIALPLAHKLVYALGWIAFPGAVYFFVRRFGGSPLARGLAALFALAGISTFGHTLDAYFSLGLAKQVLALALFPCALAAWHGAVLGGRSLVPASLLVAALVLNHPYMAWVFALLAGVLALCSPHPTLPADATRRTRARMRVQRLARTVAIVALGGGLAAFWLVPYAASPEIRSVHPLRAADDRAFDKQSETLGATLRHWADGSLLDRAPRAGAVFGGASPWAWRDNSRYGRWPVLTLFSALGAGVLLARRRRDSAHLLVVGALVSGILFLGSDDVPLLRWIPLERDFQYLHVIAMVELFVFALAGVGLAAAANGVARLAAGRLRALQAPVPRLILTCLLAAPWVVNVCQERFRVASERVVPRRFEAGPAGQTAWSLRQPGNAAVHAWAAALKDTLPPGERFLADAPDIWQGHAIFHYTLTPSYIERANLVSPVIVNMMGGINQLVHLPPLRGAVARQAVLAEWLRLRAVVGEPAPAPAVAAAFPQRLTDAPWATQAGAAPLPAFVFSTAPPVLWLGGQRDWERACFAWLGRLAELAPADAHRLPCLVWGNPGRGDRPVTALPLPLETFPVVVHPGGRPAAARVLGEPALRAYEAAGGVVLAALPPPTLAAPAPAAVAWGPTTETRHLRRVQVETAAPGLLLLKTAYARGWRVTVNGAPVPLVAVSPGYNACRIDAGTQHVAFAYTGARGTTLGRTITLATLLLLGGLSMCLRSPRADI